MFENLRGTTLQTSRARFPWIKLVCNLHMQHQLSRYHRPLFQSALIKLKHVNLIAPITLLWPRRVKEQRYHSILGQFLYMSTFILHSPADLQIKKCSMFLPIREGTFSRVSRNTQLFFLPIIPLQTSHTRVRVSHIIRVKSKSIPYHDFSLSFPLALFLPARQGEREQSVSTWNQASS